MPVTYDQAYTQITEHVLSLWDAITVAIVGTACELRFMGVEKATLPNGTFGRFVMDPVDRPRNALRNAEHGQRFENNGIIIVQLLIDRQDEKAASIARLLGQEIQSIFTDPAFPGCYIFRNVRINNLQPEPKYLRVNVTLEYQFDEIT